MICLTYINDAVSDATFIRFQLIVTHGLCKKTCVDWHLQSRHGFTEQWSHWTCPWKQLSPSCIQSSLVKENTIYAQTDSVVVGLHWSLLLEPYPTWNSTSFQVRSHSIQSRGLHCQGPVCPYSYPGVVNLMHQVYLLLFLIHVIYLIFESWWFNSVVWRFSVHQNLLVGLLKHRLMSCTEFLSKSVMGQKIHISKFPSDTGAAGA